MRLACVQTDVLFNDPEGNYSVLENHLRTLKAQDVELVVFPEAFLTGYCVDCRADAEGIALPRTAPIFDRIQALCEELGMLVIAGFAEREESGRILNAAVLVEPGRERRFYLKTHLPELGLDKFVEPGQALPVFDTRLGKIGILICYDLRPPEPARVMALQGAELIVLPTNWPVGAEVAAGPVAIVRASENRIFMATCNRVGEENGFGFIGQSKIVGPTGKVLASAEGEEAVLIADIDLSEARQKRTVNIPGKYELEVFTTRNPSLYSEITRSGD